MHKVFLYVIVLFKQSVLDLHIYGFCAANNVLSSVVWVDLDLELCFYWNASTLDPCSFQCLEKL